MLHAETTSPARVRRTPRLRRVLPAQWTADSFGGVRRRNSAAPPKPSETAPSAPTARTALTPTQREFVARYWEFASAVGRKIWRSSLHNSLRGHNIGDDDDGAGVGIDALLDTAAKYPMPCNACRGERSMLRANTGQRVTCYECGGTGEPRNQHKAIHAYLKLAILTQVHNEVNSRAAGNRTLFNLAREKQPGCNRKVKSAGWPERGPPGCVALRPDTELDAVTQTVTVRVWTARTGQVSRGSRVSVGDGTVFAPSDELRREYPARELAKLSDSRWSDYEIAYRREIRRSMATRKLRAGWRALSGLGAAMTLLCDCVRADRCHRTILGPIVAGALGGEYAGEVT